MKTKLVVTAVLLAAAGFGCQRTYEDRQSVTMDRTETQTAQLEYGEEGQREDVNLAQDLASEETEAFGGSGTAGTEHEDELGSGGGGDAGMMMHGDAGMMMMDAGTMKQKAKK